MFYIILTIWWIIGAVSLIYIYKRDKESLLIKHIPLFILFSFLGLFLFVIDAEIRNDSISNAFKKLLNKRIL